MEGDRLSGEQILPMAQWGLNALAPGWGFSAYQMVSGSNPADLVGWEDKDEDLAAARATSFSGQFAQRWKLRMTARGAALKGIVNSRLRRLLARNGPFSCGDVEIGDTAPFYKGRSQESATQWRGPDMILDIEETGVIVKIQSQTLKVAHFCVRKKVEAKDVEDAELGPLRERFRLPGTDLGGRPRQVNVVADTDVDRGYGADASSAGTPESESGSKPEMIPVQHSPALSAPVSSPRVPSGLHPDPGSSFDKAREPSQAPMAGRASTMRCRGTNYMTNVRSEDLERRSRRLS